MTRVRFPWPPQRGRTAWFEVECRKRLEEAGIPPGPVRVVVNTHPPQRFGVVPASLPELVRGILHDAGVRVTEFTVVERSHVRTGLVSLSLIHLPPPERVIPARFHFVGARERRAAQAREARA